MTVLKGRVAVITGGSRGIGLAIAHAYRAAGAHVVLAARKADGLAAARAALEAVEAPGGVHTVVANAGEPDQAQSCVDETMARFGRLDILVNNAATNPYHGDLIDLDLPRAEKTVRVNQYGMLAWIRCAWKASMAEHGGAVVNIASVGGLIVDPHIGYYNATKAAMIHMTRQLAYELGPKARVNAIAPGLIKTELARAVWEVREPILTAKLPLRRLGTPEDVAHAAVFLASDASSWITGQTLVIDGGALALPIGVES
ncbi:SDR family oxidoreductase [Phytohabitans rumicis]|uniref:3-ketoacyl-ACP reductase n=1 Tax=Phytohabitans rumicis TaxID=1076125 RepID=A0A6V8KVP8_9ACTN|nr:SDR family oxidoreductase [Phytohabitans rumicis]GFJ86481.1 3-ketoacyl-ACP reductase [Phytohabitans rumicis]